ncbi:hypothetical protein PALB_23260 [Pseudoalteromonas luteoviolacea B = ATCC 29581]|nr:hypothetical protein PALB_23260 [Pseudoalteromonas luteoviolacea B = ATCC 29581]
MEWLLVAAALMLSGVSCFYFIKANQCACKNAKQCNKPIDQYWLFALISAALSLFATCFAFHSETGSLVWIIMMSSCFLGAHLAGFRKTKQQCRKSRTKPANDLLING